jgi:NAD-dependent dihydropyrimidine dehydrogenase PreA subunit
MRKAAIASGFSAADVKGLGATEREVLADLAAALFPAGGAIPVDGLAAHVPETMERYLAAFAPGVRRGLRLLLRGFDLLPLASGHRRRFRGLTAAERDAFVRRTAEGPLWRKLALMPLKQLCTIAYCNDPMVAAAIGSDEQCLDTSPKQRGPRLRPLMHPELRGEVAIDADVCVVGSGAGGAVVAKELAEAGWRVAVIEEGGYFTQDDFTGPLFDRVQRFYRDQGTTTALGWPPIPLPVGKAVGGTTVVNSGTCFRTPPFVLAAWERDHGIDDIDPNAMAPRFARVEAVINARPVPWELLGKNATTFHRGVEALGLHGAPITRNIGDCHGCGACAFGCPSDAKQAMHLSYLPRAEARGTVIYARCRAERLLVERERVRGVEATILDAAERPQGRLRVRAPVTVLAAGALHTPLLLRRNALARSRHVGRHLRIHPAVAVAGIFAEQIHAWRGTLQSYYVDDLLASDRLMVEVTSPLPGLTAGSHPAVGLDAQSLLARYRHLVSAGVFVSDTSEGHVAGTRTPRVFYGLNADDTRRLVTGIAFIAKILFAAGAESVYTGLPGRTYLTHPRDVERLAGDHIRPAALALTGWHPMGTCRMSATPAGGVVGADGEVFGAPGLYVADASILPSCVGVNPQVTIMAFATRIAERLIARGV